MYLAETHIKYKDREKLKEKGYEKITMHILTKKVGISPDKIDFKIRSVTRDKKKKRTIYNVQRVDPPWIYYNPHHKYIKFSCMKQSDEEEKWAEKAVDAL